MPAGGGGGEGGGVPCQIGIALTVMVVQELDILFQPDDSLQQMDHR
jgi:hypothetical protein